MRTPTRTPTREATPTATPAATSTAAVSVNLESPTAPASTGTSSSDTYHHGDLRRVLLDAAAKSIAENGAAALSLRALAATAGVSHAAPVHHFGDKAGLFTAVASEGFTLLGEELHTVWTETGDFLEIGVGYIRFALEHRGHFEVMFQPELMNLTDPRLVEAKARAFATLDEPLAAAGPDRDDHQAHLAGLASWSIVHGLATLAVSDNLSQIDLADPEDLARHVLMFLRVV
jgi:AcrR family transcriptional regulator